MWAADDLTFEPVLAQALILILSVGHAVATVEAGPAVTRAAVHTLLDGLALGEAVGQVHLLVVDGHLRSRSRTCQNQQQNLRFRSEMELRSHLSHAALKHSTDVGRFGQDVHVWNAAQVHGCVDVEALGLAWRGLSLHWAMINL